MAIQHRPDHKKTHKAIQQAISTVQQAAHPRKNGILSWAVALSAGALVAWRGFRAALEDPPLGRDGNNSARNALAPLKLNGRMEASGNKAGAATWQARGERQNNGRYDSVPPSVPGEEGKPQAAPLRVQNDIVGLAKEFVARYNGTDCPARAAALSFFGVLSLVPLLLFAVAALGFFIRDPNQARQYVEHVVATLLPGRDATQAAEQVIQQTHLVDSARSLMEGKWWTVLIGFLSLIYAVLGLFVSAADPMNAAWEVKETRSFIRLRVICLEVFAGAGLFFLLSLAISSGLWHPTGAPWAVNALLSLVYEAVAIALNAVMFTLIYRFLPNTQVTWRAAAFGGIVAGVLYEIIKKGFELYLSYFGNFNNKMYGALGGIVLLVTWIYYGSMLLLSGAIVARMYHEHKEGGGVRRHPRMTE